MMNHFENLRCGFKEHDLPFFEVSIATIVDAIVLSDSLISNDPQAYCC